MNTEDLYTLIKSVSDTSNFSAKMQILADHRNDLLLQFVLENSYNFFKNYGYTKLKLPKKTGKLDIASDEGRQLTLEVLNDLNKGRILNTNKDWFANSFLEKFNLTSQLILIKILCKNMGLKLTPDDLKVLWPELLPKFGFSTGFMYSNRYRKMLWEQQDDYFVSQTHNGIRCFVIKDHSGEIKVYTKRRRPVLVVNRLIEKLKHLLKNQYAVVIEGFLKRTDEKGNILKLDQRRLGKVDIQMLRPKFLAFDIIPLHNFIYKSDSPPFGERYNLLKEIFGQMYNYRLSEYQIIEDTDGQIDYKQVDIGPYELKYTHLIKQHPVNKESMEDMLVSWRDNNWNGLIFRKNTPFYVGNKFDILKMHKLLISKFEVFEVIRARKDYYNKGKRINLPIIKSLIIKHLDKFVFVNNGFSKDFIIEYGKKPEELKGKHIQVAYTNENLIEGLKYPMFLKIHGE